MVMYSGTATGLGEYHEHKPSHQASAFSGINYIQFNAERSKITEILGATRRGGTVPGVLRGNRACRQEAGTPHAGLTGLTAAQPEPGTTRVWGEDGREGGGWGGIAPRHP